ncbi:hypothetical protein FRC17_007149 [Serendipita sp. 399]|nr:hypothetical protein FRC17_007149 [Serendipita sp. 399]
MDPEIPDTSTSTPILTSTSTDLEIPDTRTPIETPTEMPTEPEIPDPTPTSPETPPPETPTDVEAPTPPPSESPDPTDIDSFTPDDQSSASVSPPDNTSSSEEQPEETSSVVESSDPPQFFPFVATADVEFPSATDETPAPSSASPAASSSGTRVVQPFAVTPHVNTASGSQQNAEVDSADAVALVYPWDPRIVYEPPDAWVSTTSSSSIGNCHNGTKVATQAGATIKFGFEGKQISLLICEGSKGGDFSVEMDSAPAGAYSGYKDPTVPGSSECIIAQPFTGNVTEGWHNITVIVKGSRAGALVNDAAVEFSGFIYRGPHAFGTKVDRKPNLPAIIGGAVGGVVGGVALITFIIVYVILRRRKKRQQEQNQRLDDAPAVHQVPAAAPVSAATPYTAVPTTEYYDPYASAGYGPQQYPNPTGGSGWAQTSQGPFGSGSYIASGGDNPPAHGR